MKMMIMKMASLLIDISQKTIIRFMDCTIVIDSLRQFLDKDVLKLEVTISALIRKSAL